MIAGPIPFSHVTGLGRLGKQVLASRAVERRTYGACENRPG